MTPEETTSDNGPATEPPPPNPSFRSFVPIGDYRVPALQPTRAPER